MNGSSTASVLSRTGIAGLDAILEGGLPSDRLYMVRGLPGVGKTTLAMQFLLEGAAEGETVLYITLSETRAEIEGVAQSHGWDLASIHIFELSALEEELRPETQNTIFHSFEIELNRTTELLLRRIEQVKPRRIVIDSLSELRLLSDSGLRYRRQMLALKQYFAGQRITVVLLDDQSAEQGDGHVQSIAHGVLTIEQVESDYGAERRRIKINKLRGRRFLAGYHDATILRGGMVVFPRLVAAGPPRHFEPDLLKSGVAGLDTLLGGGLDRGTSCLLLGPAGTGKSTLALKFAHAAAQRGEKAFLCLFEEQPRTLLIRARMLGMSVDEMVADGRISIRSVEPAELAPGEFVNVVREQVEQRDVRVVVIDSLNGYVQAMPNVQFLNIQLHELLAYLAHQGVTSLLTVTQQGIIGVMATPVDLTYLADTVLMLRYFEQAGAVHKAISVIKKRTGAHEEAIREFKFDPSGVRVGEPLEQFQGILTGVPVFRGKSSQMLRQP